MLISNSVLACDSLYLAQTICTNKWKYKKRDHEEESAQLWSFLSILLQQCEILGVLIQFWLIEKKDNKEVAPAREGAFEGKGLRGCAFSGVMRRGGSFAFSMQTLCVATRVTTKAL